MKLNQKKSSIQVQTFDSPHQQAMLTTYRSVDEYGYPKYLDAENDPYIYLKRPNPPTPEAVEKAQFVDKTYVWKNPTTTAKPS